MTKRILNLVVGRLLLQFSQLGFDVYFYIAETRSHPHAPVHNQNEAQHKQSSLAQYLISVIARLATRGCSRSYQMCTLLSGANHIPSPSLTSKAV